MCASPQASAAGTGKLRLGQASCGGAVWASYRAKGCVDGHCVQLGALAWGWPPAWQPLPLWPRPRAVARWPSPPCAQLKLPARQPQPNRRQAAHAVLRWRLRRGPSTCRRLSLTPGTLTLSRRAVLPVDQLEQFLCALGKRRSVCSLSKVACRMELSCAPKARIHVFQAPALMTTSLTPSRQRTPLLGAPAALLRECVTAAAKSGVFTPRPMPPIYEGGRHAGRVCWRNMHPSPESCYDSALPFRPL